MTNNVTFDLVQLNNSGVECLESGKFQVAIRLLSSALQQSRELIPRNTRPLEECQRRRRSPNIPTNADTMPGPFMDVTPRYCSCNEDASGSRVLLVPLSDDADDSTEFQVISLAWKITKNQHQDERYSDHEFAMTVVSNLALAYHLLALQGSKMSHDSSAFRTLETALQLYDFTLILYGGHKGHSEVDVFSVIMVEALNNLGNVHMKLLQESHARECSDRCLSTLVLLRQVESFSNAAHDGDEMTHNLLARLCSKFVTAIALKKPITSPSA